MFPYIELATRTSESKKNRLVDSWKLAFATTVFWQTSCAEFTSYERSKIKFDYRVRTSDFSPFYHLTFTKMVSKRLRWLSSSMRLATANEPLFFKVLSTDQNFYRLRCIGSPGFSMQVPAELFIGDQERFQLQHHGNEADWELCKDSAFRFAIELEESLRIKWSPAARISPEVEFTFLLGKQQSARGFSLISNGNTIVKTRQTRITPIIKQFYTRKIPGLQTAIMN